MPVTLTCRTRLPTLPFSGAKPGVCASLSSPALHRATLDAPEKHNQLGNIVVTLLVHLTMATLSLASFSSFLSVISTDSHLQDGAGRAELHVTGCDDVTRLRYSPQVEEAVNSQINSELRASYAYLAMVSELPRHATSRHAILSPVWPCFVSTKAIFHIFLELVKEKSLAIRKKRHINVQIFFIYFFPIVMKMLERIRSVYFSTKFLQNSDCVRCLGDFA